MQEAFAQAGIPEQLWSMCLPQLEQLQAQVLPSPFGVGGRIDLPEVTGWFWGCAIAPDCLLSSLQLSQQLDFVLLEQPQVDYYVIARLTPWDASLMNSLWASPALVPLPEENVAAFFMERGTYEFSMPAGSAHGGCMLCMLPSFLERELGADAPRVMQAMEGRLDLNHALDLRTTLRAIRPERALHAGAQPFFRAKALEALGALAALVCDEDETSAHANGSEAVGERVRQLLATSLTNPPTIDELAQALGLSRTTLCTRFRAQTGMSVGSCLCALRMDEAKTRLRETNASVADIAAAVGYHNPAAFSTAFRRTTGLTPQAWRQAT